MRKMLNTLFVTTEDAYLSLENENIVVHVGEEKRAQYPLLMLEGILTFSYKGASPALMGACAERGIGLTFLTPRGRFLARVCGRARQCSAAPRAVSARRQPIRQLPDCTEFHLRQGIQSALGAGAYHP